METPILYPILSAIVVSLISLVGISLIWMSSKQIKRVVSALVAMAIGALLGDAFIHLLPEAFSDSSNPPLVSVLVIGGIISFFALEKFLHWQHCNSHANIHNHETDAQMGTTHGNDRTTGHMVIVSDSVHNFIDGLVIGTSYFISTPVGIATTMAIILHEVPQEMGDFGVLLHSGFSKARALWMNLLSALTAIAGVIVALVIGTAAENLALIITPIAAGMFIYIASADLIPELHKNQSNEKALIQIVGILIGVGVMYLLLLLE